MGGTRSSGGAGTGAGTVIRSDAPASEFVPGSIEWAISRSPQWLLDEVEKTQTPQDVARLRRRANKEQDQGLDKQNGWSIGGAKMVLDDRLEFLASQRAQSPSAGIAREDRILQIRDSSGRATARRWGGD